MATARMNCPFAATTIENFLLLLTKVKLLSRTILFHLAGRGQQFTKYGKREKKLGWFVFHKL